MPPLLSVLNLVPQLGHNGLADAGHQLCPSLAGKAGLGCSAVRSHLTDSTTAISSAAGRSFPRRVRDPCSPAALLVQLCPLTFPLADLGSLKRRVRSQDSTGTPSDYVHVLHHLCNSATQFRHVQPTPDRFALFLTLRRPCFSFPFSLHISISISPSLLHRRSIDRLLSNLHY